MESFGYLRCITGCGDEPDQVPRLHAFLQEHKDWRIAWDAEYRLWRALRLRDGGEDSHVRYLLKDLLDTLEKEYQE